MSSALPSHHDNGHVTGYRWMHICMCMLSQHDKYVIMGLLGQHHCILGSTTVCLAAPLYIGQHHCMLGSTTVYWAAPLYVGQHHCILGSTTVCWAAPLYIGQHHCILGSTTVYYVQFQSILGCHCL